MHRCCFLCRSPRTICTTLSDGTLSDQLPTFDPTGAAERVDDDHLFISVDASISTAHLWPDPAGWRAGAPLMFSEWGRRIRPCGKREAEKATIDVSVETRTGRQPPALYPPGTARNASRRDGRWPAARGRRGAWRDGPNGSVA